MDQIETPEALATAIKATRRGRALVVLIGASWCAPCKVFKPVVEEAFSKGFNLVYLDADKKWVGEGTFGSKVKVRGVPILLIYRHGKLAKYTGGAASVEELQKWARGRARG